MLPRLIDEGPGKIALAWVEAIDGGPQIEFRVVGPGDGGKTFANPIAVHGTGAGRPGFTAASTGGDGSLVCAWLDGRNGGQQPFVSVQPKPQDVFGGEQLVYAGPSDKGICPCCDLAVVRDTAGATFVAFRNADGGYRDIYVVVLRRTR